MQSGGEYNFEAFYAIKYFGKLSKAATETYRILKTSYGFSCMR